MCDDLAFTLCSVSHESKEYLLCTQKRLRLCPPAGLVSVARMVVSGDNDYELQVLFKSIDKGRLSSVDEFIDLCLKMRSSSGYKFCPGLSREVYDDKYASVLQRES